ncbi:FAD-dependent oxidoreductase [Massilia sp. TN1-12]|uniref:FAD-dependent oxidoreductase n=1 Tax=Massilia paldalensis TaxID=3377675 RepID=UPI00384B3B6D
MMTIQHVPARPSARDFPIVIVGAGMAAYALARELRKRDRDIPLLLVTADAGTVYAKPMLSNALAAGRDAERLASAGAAEMAAVLGITILPHTRVTGIDTAAHVIDTTQGPIGYGRLVLALGAGARRPQLQGDAAHDVLAVDHLEGYALLRQRLDALGRPAHVAILGAGLAGCEFAEDFAAAGHRVTLVEPARRPLAQLVPPPLSLALLRAWRALPIAVRQGSAVAARRAGAADTGGVRLQLDDGGTLDADLVLAAIGSRPNVALAREAGLATARGILVDGYGRAGAPDVYALGDCAEYESGAGQLLRPGVAALQAAARALAATLCGMPTPVEDEPVLTLKSPLCPIAVCAPAPGTHGEWQLAHEDQRSVARFVDDGGVLRGFALTRPTPAARRALMAQLDRVVAVA